MVSSDPGILSSLFLTALFLVVIVVHESHAAAAAADSHLLHVKLNSTETLVPLMEEGELQMLILHHHHETTMRRKLRGSFKLCAMCTCCGGARRVCLPSPCCYAINCNIPNRPFGFCSFTPKTCNCFGCHL